MARQGLGTENCCNKNQASVRKPDMLTVNNRIVSFSRPFPLQKQMPGSYSNSASPLRTAHGDHQWHLFGCICVHTQQCLLAEGQRVLSELGFSGCWAGSLCPRACGSCLWPRNYEVSCWTLLEAGVFLSDRSVQEAELAISFHSLALLICREQQGSQQCWRKPSSVPPPWVFDLH